MIYIDFNPVRTYRIIRASNNNIEFRYSKKNYYNTT